MSVEDVKLTAATRKILTSFWIDITLVQVRVTRGVIYIRGRMQRMTYEHQELTEKNLNQIDLSLRRLKNVRKIYYDLRNWKRDGFGFWRQPKPDPKERLKPLQETIEIEEPEEEERPFPYKS